MALADLLTETCTVQVEEQTRSPTGGSVSVLATVANGIPTRVGKLSAAKASAYAGAFDITQMYRFYFNQELNLTVKNWILFNGSTYQVVGVYNVQFLNECWEVDTVEKPRP